MKKSSSSHLYTAVWWRRQMETFSALLCAGNSPVTGNSHHKSQWRRALMFSLICNWINGWVNNREAVDYDVTVIVTVLHIRQPIWSLESELEDESFYGIRTTSSQVFCEVSSGSHFFTAVVTCANLWHGCIIWIIIKAKHFFPCNCYY